LSIYASVLGAAEWKRNGKSFNFLKEEFQRSDSEALVRNYVKWGAMVLGIFLFAVLLSIWFKTLSLEKRNDFLKKDMIETYKAAFPFSKKIQDPLGSARGHLKAKKYAMGGGNGSSDVSVLEVLNAMSRAIPQQISFQIVTLFWERGKLEVIGKTDSFKTVNIIQESLAKTRGFSGVNVSNAKSKSTGKDVEFKITIGLAGKI
jgi:type II secretory pathway component PulL